MKLQNLLIIFIIILLPIIMFMMYYTNLQKATLNTQTLCDTKLIDAAKQSIEAFEVNTVEWNEWSNRYYGSKRRDIQAAVNTFIKSFSNNLNITGTSQENILTYIPAIMYNLYSGYYLYTPTSVPTTLKNSDGNTIIYSISNINTNLRWTNKPTDLLDGSILYECEKDNKEGTYNNIIPFTSKVENAKKEYKYILKTFTPYSEKVKDADGNFYVIEYTLDNYIKIHGKYIDREGYLLAGDEVITNKKIKQEQLYESIRYEGLNDAKKYQYVYNQKKQKCYYDTAKSKFFRVFDNKRIDLDGLQNEYKVVSILLENGEVTKYYQKLNNGTGWNNGKVPTYTIKVTDDVSAMNYYAEAKAFTNWINSLELKTPLRDEQGNIQYDDSNGIQYENSSDIFQIKDSNNPEDELSKFHEHKIKVMKSSIIENLRLSMASYNTHNTNYEYKLPIFTFEDWQQILNNVSMTAFIQGLPIGLKTYNNYSIAISSNNNEYINPKDIYYIAEGENYYHKFNCPHIINTPITGYRNTDFIVKTINTNDNNEYYFKHKDNVEGCYYCVISSVSDGTSLTEEKKNAYINAYNHAIARERYNQFK